MKNEVSDVQLIDFSAIWNVLKRQRRIAAYSAVLVIGAAILFLALAPQKYTATALLIVDPTNGQIMENKALNPASASVENARIDSEVEILRSDALMLSVINQMGLSQDPEFMQRPSLPKRLASLVGRANAAPGDEQKANAATLARFENAVQISRRGLTHLIAVSVESHDPARAADLANYISNSYIERQIAGKVSARLVGRDALVQQISAARERLAQSEDRFDLFLETQLQSISDAAPSATLMMAKELGETRLSAAAKQELLEKSRKELAIKDWEKLADLLDDPELRKLAIDRETFARGDTLVSELAQFDASLQGKVADHLDGLERQISLMEKKAATLRLELRQNLPTQFLSSRQIAELFDIQQQANIEREQYQRLLVRLGDMETQAALQIANSRLVSPAITPIKASFPDPTLVLLVALALSVGLGGTMAFLNEHFIGGVTSPEQFGDVVQTKPAGILPETYIENTGRISPADRIIDAPLSGYAEAHRKLKANIDLHLRTRHKDGPGGSTGTIMITSAVAGEGKTTAALALARTYALAGRKTLLIDADLRKPSVHTHLGHQPERGLCDYLRAPEESDGLRSFYARDISSDLAIILGAGRAENATDQLLISDHFMKIIEQAREIYEITIIDTPPVLPVVDAQYIAPHVDIAILAAKWGATSQSDLRSAAQILGSALAPDAAMLPTLTRCLAPQRHSDYGAYYQPYSAAI